MEMTSTDITLANSQVVLGIIAGSGRLLRGCPVGGPACSAAADDHADGRQDRDRVRGHDHVARISTRPMN